MKKTTFRKRIFLSILLTIPTTLLFGGLLVTDVAAAEYIPEPDAKNNWQWNIAVGDNLTFENEYLVYNPGMGGTIRTKLLEIVNITGFENATVDFMGGDTDFSYVNAESLFYNVSSMNIESSGPAFNLTGFNFNDAHPPGWKEYLQIGDIAKGSVQLVPWVVPTNGSNNFEANVSAQILNVSYYTLGSTGIFNKFDGSGFDNGANRVWLTNSTDGYYVNYTYYDNGTLAYGDGHLGIKMGPVWGNVTFNLKRAWDFNITEDTTWDADVGDSYYYGNNADLRLYDGMTLLYDEMQIEIIDIKLENMMMQLLYPSMQYFSVVYANISFWNYTSEQYELRYANQVVGMANDLIPLNIFAMMGDIALETVKGAIIENDLNITSYYLSDALTAGDLPRYDTSDWEDSIIEMLDGAGGSPTGEYFKINIVDEGFAGGSVDSDNITIYVSNDELYGQDLSDLTSLGQFFNIRERNRDPPR